VIGRAARIAALAQVLWACPVVADAPATSLHPAVRPLSITAAAVIDLAQPRPEMSPEMSPEMRPLSQQDIDRATRPETRAFLGPNVSVRPVLRPPEVEQKAMARKRLERKGAVCGNLAIQGEVVGFVPGRIKACGIKDAVRVRSVAGVALSQQALMNCATAQALNSWVENGVKPAFRRRGPVVELKVAAHYACRTRNNQPGGRISEHGKGNAIDISGFTMKDGEVVTVLNGWGKGTTLKPLRQALKSACGPFGTVLGPQSDRYHQDHFHLDTASYRSGPYCK
jgi:hypothetical protein